MTRRRYVGQADSERKARGRGRREKRADRQTEKSMLTFAKAASRTSQDTVFLAAASLPADEEVLDEGILLPRRKVIDSGVEGEERDMIVNGCVAMDTT